MAPSPFILSHILTGLICSHSPHAPSSDVQIRPNFRTMGLFLTATSVLLNFAKRSRDCWVELSLRLSHIPSTSVEFFHLNEKDPSSAKDPLMCACRKHDRPKYDLPKLLFSPIRDANKFREWALLSWSWRGCAPHKSTSVPIFYWD